MLTRLDFLLEKAKAPNRSPGLCAHSARLRATGVNVFSVTEISDRPLGGVA